MRSGRKGKGKGTSRGARAPDRNGHDVDQEGFVDFTTATPWEALCAEIEAKLGAWKQQVRPPPCERARRRIAGCYVLTPSPVVRAGPLQGLGLEWTQRGRVDPAGAFLSPKCNDSRCSARDRIRV